MVAVHIKCKKNQRETVGMKDAVDDYLSRGYQDGKARSQRKRR